MEAVPSTGRIAGGEQLRPQRANPNLVALAYAPPTPPHRHPVPLTMAHDHQYHPKDTIGRTIKTTMVTAGAGTFVSAIQNTLQKQNYGPMGVFTRSGTTIATFSTPALR